MSAVTPEMIGFPAKEVRSMFTSRPEIIGTFGAVASTHWLASAVGMAVLEKGGNAFDAACAAGFTLQVVEPHLNGPGGDCPIILHSVAADAQEVICGQGVAPAAATIGHFESIGLDKGYEGPEVFAQRLRRERARWAGIIRSTGFKALDER